MFKTGIVTHYVKEYSNEEAEKTKSVIYAAIREDNLNPKISLNGDSLNNIVNQLPIGTIICKNLTDLKNETVICFPFLSSHISLPVKSGEEIWYFTDSETDFNEKYHKGTPLLSIKNYWMSRKIGIKLSEDVNFTNIQRNTLISDIDSNENLGFEEIRLPTNKQTSVYLERYDDILPDIPVLYDKSKKTKEFFPAPVPRWNSKSYELTLQGSNNSIVNLTKNINHSNDLEFEGKGAIDIVAGRHSLQDYKTYFGKEENVLVFNESDIKDYNQFSSLNDAKIEPVYLSDDFLKISNSHGDYESLKDPEYYLNYEIPLGSKKEGEKALDNDASRLYISEFDNVDNSSFYDIRFINKQVFGKIDNTSESNVIVKTKNYKNSSSTKKYKVGNENKSLDKLNMFDVTIKNFGKSSLSKVEDKILPTIFLKTNNIRIIARKETLNNFETGVLDSGSIRLIKESNDFDTYSHLLLEESGDVLIDGKSIYIGNFNKELSRKNVTQTKQEVLNRNDLTNTQKNKKIAEIESNIELMKGNGSSVFIGYDPELSEPLVLGNTLVAIITEIITLNISLADEIENIAKSLEEHVHTGIPNVGVSKAPLDKKPYNDYHAKSHKKLISKYSEITSNLKDMLSKFAKTT